MRAANPGFFPLSARSLFMTMNRCYRRKQLRPCVRLGTILPRPPQAAADDVKSVSTFVSFRSQSHFTYQYGRRSHGESQQGQHDHHNPNGNRICTNSSWKNFNRLRRMGRRLSAPLTGQICVRSGWMSLAARACCCRRAAILPNTAANTDRTRGSHSQTSLEASEAPPCTLDPQLNFWPGCLDSSRTDDDPGIPPLALLALFPLPPDHVGATG